MTAPHPGPSQEIGALGRFQDAWVRALIQGRITPDDPQARAVAAAMAQPGFAVYRNTVRKGAVDALQANYPTVAQIVGPLWMAAAAQAFVHAHPPIDGRLMAYGEGFADFLEHFPPAAGLPYLSAVAHLDRCWTESHLAADACPVEPGWLGSRTAQALCSLVLRPHPAARWRASDTCPAFALWQRHREGQDLDADLPWVGDAGLLTRPNGAVQWQPLSPAGLAFLETCRLGGTLETAATAALQAEPAADIGALLHRLTTAGALSAH